MKTGKTGKGKAARDGTEGGKVWGGVCGKGAGQGEKGKITADSFPRENFVPRENFP